MLDRVGDWELEEEGEVSENETESMGKRKKCQIVT